jgi:hypothetical protein
MPITGLEAAINGIPCLERFSIEETGEDNGIACSSSAAGTIRGEPNKDWKGVAVGFGYLPPILPGTLFTFTGADRNGQGWASGTNGAIVDAVQIFCNPNAATLFYYNLYFSANGLLTPAAYSITSAVIPNPASSAKRIIWRGGSPVSGVSYWDLLIFASNARPLWTGDSGGYPYRDAGNIDAVITWHQNPDAVAELPTIGIAEVYRLYCTATWYWEIKWAMTLSRPVNYVIRNQANEPEYIVAQNKAHFTGYYGGVKGFIKTPAASPSTYWG